MTTAQLAAIRAQLADATSGGLLLVTVDATLLPLPPAGTDAAVLVFALTLTNRHAYSASSRVTVRKTGQAAMPLTLSGPAFQTATRGSSFEILASTDYAATSLCGNPIALLKVAFVWTQLLAGSPALSTFPNMTIGGTSLVGHMLGEALPGLAIRSGAASLSLPSFAAAVGRTYVFQVTMTAAVTLAGKSAANAPTSVSALVAVKIVASPLVARIDGGDRQGMGSGMKEIF